MSSDKLRQWIKLIESAINETPIEDFSLVGDWSKNSSFRHEQDRKLLTNPKAQAKIIHKWRKTVVAFNLYFVNSPEANRHTEVGEVSYQWLETNMPKTLPSLQIRDDAVNVIFTNNKGSEREPMTAWVIAHRFGHVIRQEEDFKYAVQTIERTIRNILYKVYGKQSQVSRYSGYDDASRERLRNYEAMMLKFIEQIGTMKSAREGNIRNAYEFNYELLSQYMLTGKIKFNPLPESFTHGKMAWGKPTNYTRANPQVSIEEYNNELENLASELEGMFESLLHGCVGKIFVM